MPTANPDPPVWKKPRHGEFVLDSIWCDGHEDFHNPFYACPEYDAVLIMQIEKLKFVRQCAAAFFAEADVCASYIGDYNNEHGEIWTILGWCAEIP